MTSKYYVSWSEFGCEYPDSPRSWFECKTAICDTEDLAIEDAMLSIKHSYVDIETGISDLKVNKVVPSYTSEKLDEAFLEVVEARRKKEEERKEKMLLEREKQEKAELERLKNKYG
jgi:hypothetical protein